MAAIGDSVVFDCLPQAWPEPKVEWRHNGQLIEANEVNLPDGSAKYLIQRIATADSNVTLDGMGTNGAETLQDLQLNNNNDQVGRQIGQQLLVDLFGSRLVIKQVDKNDEGSYSCLVETKGSHRLIERESPSARLTVGGKFHLAIRLD